MKVNSREKAQKAQKREHPFRILVGASRGYYSGLLDTFVFLFAPWRGHFSVSFGRRPALQGSRGQISLVCRRTFLL
jgi:hypothetical protein